jgi:hypothetical protein
MGSKAFQKTLQKQGMKFKLSTKVISAKKNAAGKVDVVVEPAAGGPQETVRILYLFEKLAHYYSLLSIQYWWPLDDTPTLPISDLRM